MQLEYIHEFVVLTRIGNYEEAAYTLMTSPTSLSQHIKKLEEELNVSLFNRSNRKITLTSHGEFFLSYAVTLDSVYIDYRNSFRTLVHNKLNLGVLHSVAIYHLVPLIADFIDTHAMIDIDVNEDNTSVLLDLLDADLLDLAFVQCADCNEESALLQKNYGNLLIARDTLIVAVSSTHPLAQKQDVSLEELQKETIIWCTKLPYPEAKDFVINQQYTGSLRNAMGLISMGNSIAILPRDVASYYIRDDRSIVLLDLTVPLRVNILLLWKRDHNHGAVREFIQHTHSWFQKKR